MQSISGIRVFGVRLGFLLLAVYWCIIFTGTHLPKIPAAIPKVNDKVMHFTAFFLLATLLCYCTNSRQLWRRFGSILAICVFYAAIDELTQGLVRGRTPELLDFVADTCGALSAIGIYAGGRALWFQWREAVLEKI